MSKILLATLIIGGSGLILGIILAIFSKIMSVPVDEKEKNIREALPSINCGACGYSGCDGYAAALASGDEQKVSLCKPGGQAVAEKIGALLGIESGEIEKTTAMVFCQGNCQNTTKKANYTGIGTCQMAKLVAGGDNTCGYGCLGYGDCTKVCDYDAIHVIDGVAFVDSSKCTSCMKCINTCPQHIIELVPLGKAHSIVFCHNEDRAPIANKVCKASCIACGLCVRNCPENCIEIKNNRAVIDYARCTNCGACHQVCPHQCILSLYPLADLLSENVGMPAAK